MGLCSLGRSATSKGKGVRPRGLVVRCGFFFPAAERAELSGGRATWAATQATI